MGFVNWLETGKWNESAAKKAKARRAKAKSASSVDASEYTEAMLLKDVTAENVASFLKGYQMASDGAASDVVFSHIMAMGVELGENCITNPEIVPYKERIQAFLVGSFNAGYQTAKSKLVLDPALQGKGVLTIGKLVDGYFVPMSKFIGVTGKINELAKAKGLVTPTKSAQAVPAPVVVVSEYGSSSQEPEMPSIVTLDMFPE